jgi:16S rRNA processing protein RimM
MPAPSTSWVTLAVITQPHGVSGRMKVKSFTTPPTDFASHKTLTDEAGNPIKLRVTGEAQGLPVITVEGVTRREQAELWRGKKLGVARDALPELPKENQFYTDDLTGMEVLSEDGARFGEVGRVVNYGAGDILEITRHGKSELYSFTHANFPIVDRAARRITIHPPEILGSESEETSA